MPRIPHLHAQTQAMCLILIAHRARSDLPLLVLANRDEFHQRASETLHQWDDHPTVFAGRDLAAGGTWMGISREGRFAAITNYRDREAPDYTARSRGHLVRDFLLSRATAADFAKTLRRERRQFRDFNLLFGDRHTLYCYSSRRDALETLPRGIHGLSNQHLNTPWPKVVKGCNALRCALAAATIETSSLLQILADREPASDAELPDTGLPPVLERALSSVFIAGPDYGTRCSSLLSIDDAGRVEFMERNFASDGAELGTERITFELAAR